MAETSAVVAAVLVAVAAVGAVPVAALAGGDAPAQQTATDGVATNESANGTLAPGERFAGVVGVQQADVQGEIEARAFGQRVAAAASNRSAAGVVATEVEDLEARLAELDGAAAELERAHENGTVSGGAYRARLAGLHAKQRAVERRLDQTATVAQGLPAAALDQRGVNVTAIRTLRSQASELTGPEVAEIARGIAGEGAGRGVGGPPAFVENRTGRPENRGNGNGPPEDAGPGDERGSPGDAGPGNDTGPPEETGAGNDTGPPEDAGPGNRTGPPEDGGAGTDTGPPEDGGAGTDTGPPEDGGAGNETGSPEDAGTGNGTDRGSGDEAGGASDGAGNGSSAGGASDGAGNGSNAGDSGDTGSDGAGGAGEGDEAGDGGSGESDERGHRE